MENQMWYYLRNNEQIGPISKEELARLLTERSVSPDTYIWAEGMADWLPAGQVPEFGGTAVMPTAEAILTEAPPPGVVRPTPVTVFGILNIVFGGLGLLCMPLALVPFFLPEEIQQEAELGPGMQAYLLVRLGIGFVINILLLATGIGLLNLKRWARQWSYYYGWIAIILAVLTITITVIISVSGIQGASEQKMAEEVGGLIGGMCGGIIALIYPVFVLVYMKRPNVIDACQR